MQVATLFRESATLLGASMETGGVGATGAGGGGALSSDGPASITNQAPGGGLVLGLDRLDHFNHPNSNKFKLNMKLEPHDDGYETSADLMLSNATNHNDSLKCESMEDPYSFIDEDPMPDMPPGQQGMPHCVPSINVPHPHVTLPAPKKRGRKKKIKPEPGLEYDLGMNGNGVPTPPKIKERKKHDRFNGMPEEEVSKRTLPDHLATNLDIIIIGINPGLFAAYKGHHYAGPGNHFWKCLYLSGLTPEQMTADEDYKLLQVGIGFTNMVQRPTKGSADLTRKEIKEGCQILLEKLQRFKPKIAVFNGKLIYEVFSGKKDFSFGRQPDLVDGTNTYMWVMPSSSARCAQLPRAADKVPFYAALKKFRDYLNGIVTNIDDSEVVFSDSRLKGCCESESKADSLYSMDLMDISNAIVKREGEMIPCKKKRGRPKKIKTEGEEVKPVVRKVAQSQNVNNCDFPKKKRGRPKKNKCEDIEVSSSMHERNTRTPLTNKCFSTPSPIHSPNFCHINPPMASSNSSSSGMYNNNNGGGTMPLTPVHQQQYSQSPRPHSQPFTHSDLSSEISAAISSDHLGSPAPTSPSLGPPDFDPPTSMPTEDTTTECRFSSPTPSTASEQQTVATPYSTTSYHTFGIDNERFGGGQGSVVNNSMQVRPSSVSDYKVQDMSSKSLSGLESLVDQIPSIADGEPGVHHHNGGGSNHPGGGGGMHHMSDGSDQYTNVYSGYVPVSGGTPTRSGLTNSPGPVSSPGPQNYNYNSYGTLSVASLTGGGGGSSNSFNNYGHHTPPSPTTTNSYHSMMGQGHSFMEHHGCPMPLSPYTQLPPPYGHQQFTNSYPPAPPGIHMPSPNYPPGPAGHPPPPYYNSGYPQTQTGSPHYHMFDRIKPDIGYGSF